MLPTKTSSRTQTTGGGDMVDVLYQPGMFREMGHYLFVSINAPGWAHDLLLRLCPLKESTYQIVEGPITWVGYEFSQAGAHEAKKQLDQLSPLRTLGATNEV